MDTNDLINNLEFEYHSTAAANPNWEMSWVESKFAESAARALIAGMIEI